MDKRRGGGKKKKKQRMKRILIPQIKFSNRPRPDASSKWKAPNDNAIIIRLDILKIIWSASLAVTLGTLVGFYFPDGYMPDLVVGICAVIAIKHLTSFPWYSAVFLFFIIAGFQNTGGSVPTYILGRSLLAIFITSFMCIKADSRNADHDDSDWWDK